MIDEDTQFLKEAAEELVTEKTKNVKSSDSIIKLQADLIECQKNNIEALAVTFDKKASEVVEKLSEKMLEIPEPCSTEPCHKDNNSMSESVKDWSKIDFTTSITNAVAQSLKTETIKERKRAQRSCNIMLYGVKAIDSQTAEARVYKVVDELCIARDNVEICSQVPTKSDKAKGQTFRVTLSHPIHVVKALRKAKCLKDKGVGYNNVYVTPDRTPEQHQRQKELVDILKKKIEAHPHRRWVIRSGKVIDGGQFQ